MTDHDIPLDPDAGLLDHNRYFSNRGILTYFFFGLAFLITIFSVMMWADTGYLVETWSAGRLITVLVACIYGLGLGWMLYPRLLKL